MTHCAIVTQTIRANDVRVVLYINGKRGRRSWGGGVLMGVITVKSE